MPLIREYVVEPGEHLDSVDEDLPADVRRMTDGGYPAWILKHAAPTGSRRPWSCRPRCATAHA